MEKDVLRLMFLLDLFEKCLLMIFIVVYLSSIAMPISLMTRHCWCPFTPISTTNLVVEIGVNGLMLS